MEYRGSRVAGRMEWHECDMTCGKELSDLVVIGYHHALTRLVDGERPGLIALEIVILHLSPRA